MKALETVAVSASPVREVVMVVSGKQDGGGLWSAKSDAKQRRGQRFRKKTDFRVSYAPHSTAKNHAAHIQNGTTQHRSCRLHCRTSHFSDFDSS